MKKILIALAMLTSGCANLLNHVGDKEKLGPPDLFTPYLEVAVENAGSTKPADATCQTASKADLMNPAPDPGEIAQAKVCPSINEFAKAVRVSRNKIDSESAARNMFKAGANVSDGLCFNWFAQLDGIRRASGEARDTVAGLGALTNAVQVLTGVEPNGIGIATATFNQVGLGFDALERNYLLPSDLAIIYNALKTYRERTFLTYLGGVDGNASVVTSYYDAERYLRAYHDTCSSNAIQFFILNSVSQGGVTNKTASEQAADLMGNVGREELRLSVAEILNIVSTDITFDDVKAIAGYVVGLDALGDKLADKGKDKYRDKYLAKDVTRLNDLSRPKLGDLVKPDEVAKKLKDKINGSSAKGGVMPKANELANEFKKPDEPAKKPN